MFSMSHHPPPVNGGLGEYVEGSGTINPAALDAPAVLPPASSSHTEQSPRGLKRGRSEDAHEAHGVDDDDSKPRKRGRPPKSKIAESPISTSQALPSSGAHAVQTPRSASQVPQTSPPQTSPTRVSSGKGPVIKALPTVRDHTTDQLNPEGDEYIPREFDEAGEKKVQPNGALLDGREYKCRTFWVPGRSDKLFMLATECARVLGYRDSYLLFNKNRSLHKIIANQAEKDHLIAQDILPYSYRSRQIAIVTARSMFRQFGSRVIANGRRVRDDYWEAKAIKQGFTEEDPAGEKRPGGARQRAALEAAQAETVRVPQHQIYYENKAGTSNVVYTFDANNPLRNLEHLHYGGTQGARSNYSAFQDRGTSTNSIDMHSQAVSASEFNRGLSQQRANRKQYLEEIWHRPHEPPPADPQDAVSNPAGSTQATQSPHVATAGVAQTTVSTQPQQTSNPIMTQAYSQQPGPSNMMAQTPIRSMHAPMSGGVMNQRSPSLSVTPQQQNYGYQQAGMWHPGQPQPTPMAQQHPGMPYNQHMTSQSPVPPSPMHHPPQLQHQNSGGSVHAGMGYAGMQSPAFANVQQRQQMYQPSPSPHQFMQPGAQPGWPQQPGQQGQQGWQQF
ncbi:hypothetical protein, variant [Verruconis gallopava]|uniref:Chromatin structure-remodeling complex protein RSC7 n=1 Tax=Verruconis gallopava TaxID=253628 RepID=A0A0D2B5Z0_9PEZI|nr:uncharacterized protein PV09_02357 [Verruconis gallopava]XP_016216518.1 hypothetical protein, variant [Verruconis gallopava]KIW06648.1 hypothetical protein PV09_02357 [Verruconis gallopava]KIW06649.1 hypothetical protein, variant [Verruconis gallopava]